jgi:glc operon protein GlcG
MTETRGTGSALTALLLFGTTIMVQAAQVDFTPLQGGIPIIVDGAVVGAIGVSGAASQQRDEEVAKAGAAALR